jgi:tellurite resistance protein TerC
VVSAWVWLLAGAVITVLLALDLLVFHRHAAKESTRRAVVFAVIWVVLGLLFALVVGGVRGWEASLEYLTAYLIEKALSVDNLFVFLVLFSYFGIEPEYQHRVLFWGILGAIVTRGLFIFGGVALLHSFHWILYVLGGILVVTGVRLALVDEEVHPERNHIVRWASRVLPLERSHHGEQFFIRTEKGWRATPLVLVFIAIESTDVMFAVDSVPAVLGVSQDPFVVYTSNIFAILGLRALYFVIANALRAMRYLRCALVVILILVGAKMLLANVIKVPITISLGAVGAILGIAIVASLLAPKVDRT